MEPATGSGALGGQQIRLQVARELARKFFHAVARRQLLAAGVARSQIQRWIGSNLWWQNLLPNRPDLIHIAAPRYVASVQDLRVRHPRVINRHIHDGLPVVDLARALLLATEGLDRNALRNVLARADFEGLLLLPSLQAACALGPRGSRKLRAAMDSHLPQLAHCVNDFERDFVLLCEEHGLPIPDPNVRMGRYVPDMLWRDRMLIVELDGKDAHTSPAQKHRDEVKQEWLEAQGHTVIRFRWGEVHFERSSVAARVRPHLGR